MFLFTNTAAIMHTITHTKIIYVHLLHICHTKLLSRLPDNHLKIIQSKQDLDLKNFLKIHFMNINPKVVDLNLSFFGGYTT